MGETLSHTMKVVIQDLEWDYMKMSYFKLAEYCLPTCVCKWDSSTEALQGKPAVPHSEVEQGKLDQWKTKLVIYIRYSL